MEVQFLKLGRNIENGSRSTEPANSQIRKNNAVLAAIEAAAKK